MAKSISQLQKEIKELESKKRGQIKLKELEDKLERLKHPSKFKRKIGVRERIRMGFGGRISRSLDLATGVSRPVKRKRGSFEKAVSRGLDARPTKRKILSFKHPKKRKGNGMLNMMDN